MVRSRAAIMPAAHAPVEVLALELPQLEPDSAVLEVLYSEVCGTDVHLHHGLLEGVPYPIVPGHVTVGHLESIRGTVHDVDGRPLRPGGSGRRSRGQGTGRSFELTATRR